MADTLNELGHILTADHGRDAVHIAVCPVTALEKLTPGTHVGLVSVDGATPGGPFYVGRTKKSIGIIDPYLRETVQPEQRCWLFLYPHTITSLRHLWTHPAFPAEADTSPGRPESEAWLRGFAEEVGVAYRTLMDAAQTYLDTGEDYFLSYDTPDVVYSSRELFWKHYATVTGRVCPEPDATFFRCAC